MRSAILQNVGLAVVYVAVARLGLALDAMAGFASVVWPPTGIAIAAVVVAGFRVAPGIAVGAFAVNAWAGAPLGVAAGIGAGNTLEAVVAVWALRRAGFDPSLSRLRDVVSLVVLAAVAATTISATIGVGSLTLGGRVAVEDFAVTWRSWWIGDALGALVVTPLLLVWRAPLRAPEPKRALEAVVLAVALAGFAAFIFGLVLGDPDSAFRRPYALFPFFVWAAVRFELRGATLALFAVSVVAIVATAIGRGPFALERLHDGLLALQVFMSAAGLSTLALGAAIAENSELYRRARAAVIIRDEWITVAAHELRTPTNALLLSLDSVRELLARPGRATDEKVDRRLEGALRGTRRLVRLIDTLLDVAKLSGQKVHLDLADHDLAALARETVEQFAEPAAQVGCTVQVRVEGEVSARCDRLRIQQLLGNLLSNAFKYGPGKPVEIRVARRDEVAILAVRDHGIGIAREDVARIFDRYERAVPVRSYGGLGIGLYVARQIVEAHGGTIHVARPEGPGAELVVELPAATR